MPALSTHNIPKDWEPKDAKKNKILGAFPKVEIFFLKIYSESSFYVDAKNCRKIQIHREMMEKLRVELREE